MKHILVPIDFSPFSDYAVSLAGDLAIKSKAKVTLLHVVHLPQYDAGVLDALMSQGAESTQKLFSSINEQLNHKAKQLEELGIQANTIVKTGAIANSVLNLANELQIDFICVGLYGAEESNSFFGGSITQKLIRRSTCPVLIAKGRTRLDNAKKIVLGSSFFTENKSIVKNVAQLAKTLGAEIHMVKVITPQKFERTAYSEKVITELAKEVGVEQFDYSIINDTSIEQGLYWFADKVGADCICISTHSRTGIGQLVHKSVAEEVASKSTIPVITFKIDGSKDNEGVIFPD